MPNTLSNMIRRLLDVINPRVCPICGLRLSLQEEEICTSCDMMLPRTGFARNPRDNNMAQVFWHLLDVDRAAAWLFHTSGSNATHVIYQMKYYQRPDLAYEMGRLMAKEMAKDAFFEGIDCMLPVPLAPKRERQRGYNQSLIIAEGIHDVTGIPILRKSLVRECFTGSQTHLTREDRQDNVSQAFTVRHPDRVKGHHVLVIDDVCTTGATLTACGKVLTAIEGVRVSVLTLAFAGYRDR